MMNGDFVREFKDSVGKPQVLDVAGESRLIAPPNWHELKRILPTATPLKVGTVDAVVEYVKRNTDQLALDRCLLHVMNHQAVELVAALEDEPHQYRRQTYLLATTELVGGVLFPFGQYLTAEAFFIGLSSAFLETPERNELLAFVASIRENKVTETVDSGVAQEVKTARGVTLVNTTRVPTPVTLRPFRTFREVTQPASSFVLRLASGPEGGKPTAALIEADGGAWKLAAIQAIEGYLRHQLGSAITILA